MFGVGPFELLVIAVVALIFVGPSRLPSVMRQFGKFFVQAKRYSGEMRDTFQSVVDQAERELREEEAADLKKTIAAKKTTPQLPEESEKVEEEEWQPHPPTEGFVTIEQVAAEEGWSLGDATQPPPAPTPAANVSAPEHGTEVIPPPPPPKPKV